MRTLNIYEVETVSGGFLGPAFVDDLLTAAAVVFGLGIGASFILGAGVTAVTCLYLL